VAGDAVSMQMHEPGVFGHFGPGTNKNGMSIISNVHQNVYFHELIGGNFEIWRPSKNFQWFI
jgi:hypothetical protein